jgi:hypothetical protein
VGLDAVVKPGALVLLGEIHGTNEIPDFVGDAACAGARKGRVHVGLELPAVGYDGIYSVGVITASPPAFPR